MALDFKKSFHAIGYSKYLIYLNVIFDVSLCGNEHIIRTSFKPEKRLVTLKQWPLPAFACHKILVIFYLTFVLSVINYGFGLLTVSTAQLNQMEIIQMNQ